MSIGEFVRSIPLFHGIRGEDLEQLEQQCKMQQFSDKQEILAEGVQSDHVWVIREGKVALVQTDRATGKRTVGMTLTQGDYFGVSAVMKSKSVATYQAHGSVLCIRIPAQLFERSITTPNLIGASSANSNLATSEEVQSLSQHLERFTETLHFLDKHKQTQSFNRDSTAGMQASTQVVGSNFAHLLFLTAAAFLCVFRRAATPTSTSSNRRAFTTARERRKSTKLPFFSRTAEPPQAGDGTTTPPSPTETLNVIETSPRDLGNKSLVMELLSAFAPELDVEDILERMVRAAAKALQVERVYVLLVDEESDQLTLAVRLTSCRSIAQKTAPSRRRC